MNAESINDAESSNVTPGSTLHRVLIREQPKAFR